MNSASRLWNVFKIASDTSPKAGTIALTAWGVALAKCGLNADSAGQITRSLILVDDELTYISDSLERNGVAVELFHPQLADLHRSVATHMLHQPWDSTKVHIGADALLALKWAERTLGDEEAPITDAEKNDLIAGLAELTAALATADLPVGLAAALRKHVARMRGALDDYPLTGIAPLREAYMTAVAEIVASKDELKESGTIEAARAVWPRLAKFLQMSGKVIDGAASKSKSVLVLISTVKEIIKITSNS